MPVADLYGYRLNNLDEAMNILSVVLNIEFQGRESDFVGEYFVWKNGIEENIKLRWNFDPLDEEPAELSFPEYPIILYVYSKTLDFGMEVQEAITSKVGEFVLLRHEVYEVK